jgi:hypothetical protein
VVRAQDATRYAKLRQQFATAPWVAVYLDRRRADRRRAGDLSPVERRFADRPKSGADVLRSLTHRLAYEQTGVAVYELVESGGRDRLPQVWRHRLVRNPAVGEPPARLTVEAEHEDVGPKVARYLVTLEAFGVGGRSLLSSRIVARTSGDKLR